jgi:uncharacterized protein (DUF2267 family)
MARSRLQEPFLRDIVASFQATLRRIRRRLNGASEADVGAVIEDELRGLYHGLCVTFDGGTALADEGLIRIVDEDGVAFDRNLHEQCFEFWRPEVE